MSPLLSLCLSLPLCIYPSIYLSIYLLQIYTRTRNQPFDKDTHIILCHTLSAFQHPPADQFLYMLALSFFLSPPSMPFRTALQVTVKSLRVVIQDFYVSRFSPGLLSFVFLLYYCSVAHPFSSISSQSLDPYLRVPSQPVIIYTLYSHCPSSSGTPILPLYHTLESQVNQTSYHPPQLVKAQIGQ